MEEADDVAFTVLFREEVLPFTVGASGLTVGELKSRLAVQCNCDLATVP